MINKRNSSHLLLFFLTVGYSFYACKNSNTEKEDLLTGKFVNQTFLQQIPDSIPGIVSAYCYEMDFISGDSVRILYGFEEATLAYKKKGSHFEIVKAMQDKDLAFKVNDDGTLTMSDSSWNRSHKNSVFTKSENTAAGWNFEEYLNKKMIADAYTIFKNDKPTSQKVTFEANGKVTGLDNFTSYNICYSGDCVGETYPVSNSVTLVDENKVETVFAFVISQKTRTLKINRIEEPIPDIKGERAVKELMYDLRK